MSELQFLKDLKSNIEAKIAEIESNQAPVNWEPKGGDYCVDGDGSITKSHTAKPYAAFGTERETREQAEHAAEWMRKFNRMMCWFEENAPGHMVSIEFDSKSVSVIFSDTSEAAEDLRTKIRDGVVEL